MGIRVQQYDRFFPREQVNFLDRRGSTFGVDFHPLFGGPVEDIDGVEAFFVGSTSTKNNNSIIFLIIAHGAV